MPQSKQLYLAVINVFIVLTVLALGATLYLTFAKATILVPGERERFANTETVAIAPDASDAALAGTIVSREYTLSQDYPVGSVTTTSKKAGTVVTIINTYDRSQALVRTTRLQSPDGKIFRITEPVTVPAGDKVNVFAEADQEGDSYLIGPTKFTIPGLWEGLQEQIYAESTTPMSYERLGTAVVTQETVEKAVSEMTEKLLTQAVADFQKDYPELDRVAKEQLATGQTTVATEPLIGQEASSVKVTITRSVSAVATDKATLEQKLTDQLKANLPDAESFIEIIPDTMTYQIASIDTTAKTAELSTEISAWVHSKTTLPDLDLGKLTGKKVNAALEYLRSQGIDAAEIRLTPSFSPFMPFLKSHITIEAK